MAKSYIRDFLRWVPWGFLLFFTGLLGVVSSPSQAQFGASNASAGETIPIRLEQAKQVRWVSERQLLMSTGNVVVAYGKRTIRADTIVYSDRTGWIHARGNARISGDQTSQLNGNSVSFRPSTNEIEVEKADGVMLPWFFRAERMEGTVDQRIKVTNGSFTTTSSKNPDSDIAASTIYIYPGDRIVAYHAFPRFFQYPVFYLPFIYIDLQTDLSRWDFEFGNQNRDGALLGVSYHYSLPQDDNPYTGTIYSDFRQKVKPGIGADIDYDGPLGDFYLFHFNSYREPVESISGGEDQRAEGEEYLYRLRSDARFNFGQSNWNLQGDIDWQGDDRLDDLNFRNLQLSRTSRRDVNGAVTHRGDLGLLTIQAQRDERVIIENNEETFVQNQSRLPSISYDMFSLPLGGAVGGPWNIQFSTNSTRRSTGEDEPFLWRSNARSSLSKMLPLFPGYSQRWQVGYRQQFNEKEDNTGSEFESVGSGLLSLENTFTPLDPVSLKVVYDVERRFNKENQVSFRLNRDDLGLEEDGFREHALRFNTSWSGDRYHMFFRSGFDLRNSKEFDVSTDSRVISPLLNLSGQILPTVGWTQFLRYDWARSQVDQINTRFDFEPSKNFKTALGWNFNRGLERDFSDLTHQFVWDLPDRGWRFRSDLVYDLETNELDETRLSVFRRFALWDIQINLRDIREGDPEISFNINLRDRPPPQSGAEKKLPNRERFLDEEFR